MITQDNFRKVLDALGFTQNVDIDTYYATFNNAEMSVDYKNGRLDYDSKITGGRDTTKDFHQNENFVVFECVCRLLQKGYNAENIILEATSGVEDRGQTQTYLDILVKNNDKKDYLVIECKTAGKEFDEAWAKTLRNGGQLFNYWSHFRCEHACLYASDFEGETLTYKANLIILKDENPEFLKETGKKGYDDLDKNATQNDYFDIWAETYEKAFLTTGIFDQDAKSYEISTKVTRTYEELEEISDYTEIQKKYNQFATIMRQHNVGSHENSFDKLVNLFLAKIYDENNNKGNLKFNWKTIAFDNYYSFQDRLQELYASGMDEYLGEKITYIAEQKIKEAFHLFKNDPDATRDKIIEYFHEQKFYSNNDFSFLDVHNKELFLKNIAVLIKVVQMLQDIRIVTERENQFLGDLFEGFLDQGVKQSEGQFFTPMPIVKFLISSLPIENIVDSSEKPPKVIDYACGAGHFLNEVARCLKPFAERKNIPPEEFYKQIYGIEKDYRLSKVSKVSSYMYSQNGIEIIYGDGLTQHPKIEDGTFSILVANPPYSVKGFLETLTEEERQSFTLFESDLNIERNNSIETFFIERASQLLCDGGVCAIILPSSVLSNGNIYIKCRNLILQRFEIVAIAEFGSGTFGKTGTNTVTLFMKKRGTNPNLAVHYKNRVESWFKSDFKKDKLFKDELLLKKYCEHCGIAFEEYKSWLCGGDYPSAEIFGEYKKEFENSSAVKNILKKKITTKYSLDDRQKEIEEKIQTLIKEIESEKLYYFILAVTNPQKVLIAKSPADNKEMKSYLGYEWSGAKGSEGIKYLGSAVSDDEDQISKNKGIMSIKTPLFNPNDYDDETKINVAIRRNFGTCASSASTTLGSVVSQSQFSTVNYQLLTDMLDFSRTSFDCAIKLIDNGKLKIENVKWKDFPKLKIKDLCEIGRGRVINKEYMDNHKGIYPVYSSQTTNNGIMGMIDTYDFDGEYVTWTTDGIYAGTCFYREGKFNCTNVCGTLKIKESNKILIKILPLILNLETSKYVVKVANPKLMNNVMAEIPIPLPPS